jgi:hypothetical protein
MGKRGSTVAGTAAGAAAKKVKTADTDTSVVGNWVQTKIGDKELSHAEKIGLLKNDPAESLAAGPKIVPRPPPSFRVIFLAFMMRGLSLSLHPFLRGLLFAYGIQLHDLNPNTILHIACFIMLCECFLGIEPHWALWHWIFAIQHPLRYQTGGFSCQVRPNVPYFNLQTLKTTPAGGRSGFMPRISPPLAKTSGLRNFEPPPFFDPRCLGGTSSLKKK